MSRLPYWVIFSIIGTLPFLGLSVAISLHMFEDVPMGMHLLLTYAVIIVSFFGGIHLGVSLNQPPQGRAITNLLILESVWPSLIAWGLLYTVDMHIQLLLLTLLYALTWASDSLLYNSNLIPQWFFNLRCVITPVVVVSLYVAYFGVIN